MQEIPAAGSRSRSRVPRRHPRGFTLVEMLVVLVIVSLMVTLIVQGFGYSLGVYQRVVHSQRGAYEKILAYHWLTTSLQAQVAARPHDRALIGDARQLSTYSFQPLVARSGLKSLIHWELETRSATLVLNYREGDLDFPVYSWPAAQGQFEYLDDGGRWVSQWPVEATDTLPLPKAIRLLVTSGSEALNYVVKVETRQRASVSMDELFYGRD